MLLKPNLIAPRRPEEAATTHPEVLRAAARQGVGEVEPAHIRLAGDFDSLPRIDFSLPPSVAKPRRVPGWLLPAIISLFKTWPEIDGTKCRRCGVCRESCPVSAIDDGSRIDRQICIECLCCQELCPHGAVALNRVNPLARRLLPVEAMQKRASAPSARRRKGHW